jgi:TolB protein
VDINAPSTLRIRIAIPDFEVKSAGKGNREWATTLPAILANDLVLSGYFDPIDKEAFLGQGSAYTDQKNIQFKDWSVIGADLLLVAAVTPIGSSLEVEARLYDVFRGRQLMGRRLVGKEATARRLVHRLSNEIIYRLTGQEGIFLTRLAFIGTGSGHKEIYVSDFDGYNVKKLTTDNSIALFPRWSPKDDKIAFNSFKDGSGANLYVKELLSRRVTKVSSRKGLNTGAAWAPDGKRIALTLSLGDNPDIYSIDLSGRIIKRLVTHWGIDVSPSFSPDGQKIAFVSNRSGSPQIHVKDLRNGREERLTFEGKYNTSPSWSALNRIAFAGMENGQFNIFTMNPEGGQLRRLTEGQRKNEEPSWSPDGRYIVFSSNRDGKYHLYMMNAFGQNQRKITRLKGEQMSPSWSHR